MIKSAKTAVWEVHFRPFGEVSAVSGTATLNQRFPGQWYQLEAGLANNWHRHYDATLSRYLQPDPLGFVAVRLTPSPSAAIAPCHRGG